ncbi:hypothetical protein [Clostridium folliculivorans]|uniref:hypothetical protein n=1 Tax=Clostridium folliculivorans TaxID=2886038 RepID=UPI0021C2EB28|nr:hypothetical protein [Clostridium folliculivorans]GKU31596.1 hypothetical protein CFB3_37030 [Clostridium folliculivorans]
MRRTEIDIYKVYDNWQKGLEEFQCYFKVTPFATMKNYTDFLLDNNISPSNDSIDKFNKLKHRFEDDSLYIIDFEASLALDLALLLNNEVKVKPILSFNHIFHTLGIVGDEGMAQKLLVYSDSLELIKPKVYCFVLDKDRYREDYTCDYMKFNNQYEITEEELPPADMLEAIGIKNIVYISEGYVKEDVKYYLEYLRKSELDVEEILEF